MGCGAAFTTESQHSVSCACTRDVSAVSVEAGGQASSSPARNRGVRRQSFRLSAPPPPPTPHGEAGVSLRFWNIFIFSLGEFSASKRHKFALHEACRSRPIFSWGPLVLGCVPPLL